MESKDELVFVDFFLIQYPFGMGFPLMTSSKFKHNNILSIWEWSSQKMNYNRYHIVTTTFNKEKVNPLSQVQINNK
jgi:hypothetical protein